MASVECALPLGTVVPRCLDTKMLQWPIAPLPLPLLIDSHRPGFVLCLARCSWVHSHQ